jgi:REP element-mobilizing transposase RayT
MNTDDTWNLEPPPGFQGLRDDLPLTAYHRHLPHWRQDGATCFVTFRLADSLPQSKLRELEAIKREWEAKHGAGRAEWLSVPHDGKTDWQSVLHRGREDLTRNLMQKVEQWLDQGMGSCYLKRPDVSAIVVDCLHHFDGQRYELGCYVVMPNHVHGILRPLEPNNDPLEKILQSRKRQSSREINGVVGRSGSLWHDESFDRIIRDAEHLYRCIQYVGRNPRNIGMPRHRWVRWIRPSWEKLGWTFEDT